MQVYITKPLNTWNIGFILSSKLFFMWVNMTKDVKIACSRFCALDRIINCYFISINRRKNMLRNFVDASWNPINSIIYNKIISTWMLHLNNCPQVYLRTMHLQQYTKGPCLSWHVQRDYQVQFHKFEVCGEDDVDWNITKYFILL